MLCTFEDDHAWLSTVEERDVVVPRDETDPGLALILKHGEMLNIVFFHFIGVVEMEWTFILLFESANVFGRAPDEVGVTEIFEGG